MTLHPRHLSPRGGVQTSTRTFCGPGVSPFFARVHDPFSHFFSTFMGDGRGAGEPGARVTPTLSAISESPSQNPGVAAGTGARREPHILGSGAPTP